VAALHPIPDLGPKPKPVKEGVHVLAGWSKDQMTMRCHCSTPYTADVVAAAFQSIGCETRRETVQA
jgi:hypothetical protein